MDDKLGMDEQIEAMEQDYFERQAAQEQALRSEAHPMVVEAYDGMPQDYYDGDDGEGAEVPMQPQYYPLSLAQGVLPGAVPGAATPAQPNGNILTNRYAGVPGWGWGLIGLGVLGGGYYLLRSSGKPKRNDGSEDDDDRDDDESTSSSFGGTEPAQQGWGPSRSSFGRELEKFVSRRGLPAKDIKIYTDADDAKKFCKPVSPLVTIKCSTGVTMPMADLEKFASKEGLTATDHGSGVIGFYPRPNGKRGKAWEQYIDDLRDEGQSV